jgi:hypothetical protein
VTGGGGVSCWIELTFPSPIPLDGVTLLGRHNSVDQVTRAAFRFSDGSSVPVPTLPDDGTGLTICFPVRTVSPGLVDPRSPFPVVVDPRRKSQIRRARC